MARDLGDSLRTATSVTVSSKALTLTDTVGGGDRSDLCRFTLRRNASVSLTLTPFGANANVALLNRRGKVLSQSRHPRTRTETITTNLQSGTYYVRVLPGQSRAATRYRLRLSARDSGASARNTAPTLTENGLRLRRGATATITVRSLKVTDREQSAAQLIYTLNSLPQYGRLQLNGVTLKVGDRFTQADINQRRLSYTNIGKVTQLTNNNVRDLAAGISGSNIVWNRSARNDDPFSPTVNTSVDNSSEVFFYNSTTGAIRQLTDNRLQDTASGISGANIVWTNISAILRLSKVFFYNGSTGQTVQLSSNLSSALAPSISGSSVVWSELRGLDTEVFFYDATTNSIAQLTNNSTNEAAVAASGSNVIWNSINFQASSGVSRVDPLEVFFYNGTTRRTIQLSNNSGRNSAVGISDTKIVWNGFDGNDYEIFVYDIATGRTTQLTNNNTDDVAPVNTGLSGSNVIWNGSDGNDFEVFFYNSATGKTTQLTNNDTDDIATGISGSNVIWSSSDRTGKIDEVFFYNGSTGIKTQLTSNRTADFAAGISGSNVVWNGSDGNDFEVFLADLGVNAARDSFRFKVTDGVSSKDGAFTITLS